MQSVDVVTRDIYLLQGLFAGALADGSRIVDIDEDTPWCHIREEVFLLPRTLSVTKTVCDATLNMLEIHCRIFRSFIIVGTSCLVDETDISK